MFSDRFNRWTVVAVATLALCGAASAQTPDHPADTAAQFPTHNDLKSLTTSGSYLAARHASVERDAASAATFYRSALRNDPKNNELLDRAFISSVAEGDIDEAVSLANRIVASHTKADQALRLLAAQKHVDLPSRTDIDDHDELADLHDRKPGGDFDATYVKNVIDDHDRMIAMYEAAAHESVDPDIRRYADTMLPALRDNREQAVAMFNKQTGVSSTP